MIDKLRQQLIFANTLCLKYSGHSFWQRSAQHMSDNSMLDRDIQKLAR